MAQGSLLLNQELKEHVTSLNKRLVDIEVKSKKEAEELVSRSTTKVNKYKTKLKRAREETGYVAHDLEEQLKVQKS